MVPQDPGATASVIAGIALTVLLVNATLAVYARTRLSAAEHRAVGERTQPGGEPIIACPDCGTKNDPEYRYCRARVSKLPGYAANRTQFASSFGRISR